MPLPSYGKDVNTIIYYIIVFFIYLNLALIKLILISTYKNIYGKNKIIKSINFNYFIFKFHLIGC